MGTQEPSELDIFGTGLQHEPVPKVTVTAKNCALSLPRQRIRGLGFRRGLGGIGPFHRRRIASMCQDHVDVPETRQVDAYI